MSEEAWGGQTGRTDEFGVGGDDLIRIVAKDIRTIKSIVILFGLLVLVQAIVFLLVVTGTITLEFKPTTSGF